MAKVTIGKAAELTGKSRATIDRYLKSGKLSYELESGSSTRLIDPSDLDRLLAPSQPGDTELDGVPGATSHSQRDAEIAVLKERVEGLEKLIQEKDRRLALLEDQRSQARDVAAPARKTRSIFWGLWKVSE